jgi:hypothetical protein
VYRSVRELMASYVHEYITGPVKTLRGYSDVFDLRRLSPARWVTREGTCEDVDFRLRDWGFYPLLDVYEQVLRPRDAMELAGDRVVEHEAPVAA